MTGTAGVILRIAAVLTAVGTVAFLFIGGDWRWANLFLIPDLILAVVLLIGSLLPVRHAAPVLLGGFLYASGVFSAAVMSYAVDGRFGPGASIGLATSVAAGLWLLQKRAVR